MKKTKKIFGLLTIALLTAATACDKQEPEGKIPSFDLSRVYAAGYHTDLEGRNIATLWSQGKNATALTDGKHDAQATAVAVSGGKVYVVGMQSTEENTSQAVLWVDKQAQVLPAGADNAMATGLCLVDGKVYVSGTQWQKGAAMHTPVLWIDGVREELDAPQQNTFATAISTYEAAIYIAGTAASTQGGTQGVIWKNGKQELLEGDSGTAAAITVAQGKVFTAGRSHRAQSTDPYATLWIDGVPEFISESAGSQSTAVCVREQDVYVGGADYEQGRLQARLWKNGLPQELVGLSTNADSSILGVGVDGTTFYAVGYEDKRAMLWINGLRYALTDGKRSARANAVYVKQ